MSHTELQIVESAQVIQSYGQRDDVREIMNRLMMLHPAAKEVGQQGMLAVAQLAVMSGANPLPGAGEIYVWVDNKGKVVVFLGVAYYRRVASEKDTLMWAYHEKLAGQPRIMTDAERSRLGVADGDVAAICHGFKMSDYMKLVTAGIPWQQAQQSLFRTSSAIVSQSEMFYQRDTQYRKKGEPVDAPHGRTWQWVAEKRAEIGMYRMLALVDTTLTDNMQAQAQAVLNTIQREPRAEMPNQLETVVISEAGANDEKTFGGFTGAEIDEMFSYG